MLSSTCQALTEKFGSFMQVFTVTLLQSTNYSFDLLIRVVCLLYMKILSYLQEKELVCTSKVNSNKKLSSLVPVPTAYIPPPLGNRPKLMPLETFDQGGTKT